MSKPAFKIPILDRGGGWYDFIFVPGRSERMLHFGKQYSRGDTIDLEEVRSSNKLALSQAMQFDSNYEYRVIIDYPRLIQWLREYLGMM